MSREILFKAKRANWRELSKEDWWVEGNLVWTNDSFEEYRAIIIPKENSVMYTKTENDDLGFENWYLVDQETICLYTGLTDKDGRKVFENDIVNVVFLEAREGALVKTYQYKVEFDQEEASYELTGNDELLGRPCFVSANQNLMEIIGNIFDGKESEKIEFTKNKDLWEYLSQKEKEHRERIARAEKYERRLRKRLEDQPDRADITKSINETIRVRDTSRELVNFINELEELYF